MGNIPDCRVSENGAGNAETGKGIEYPGLPGKEEDYLPSTVFALSYIVNTTIEKLYTFTVTEEVLRELSFIAGNYQKRFIDRKLKSLEILDQLFPEMFVEK